MNTAVPAPCRGDDFGLGPECIAVGTGYPRLSPAVDGRRDCGRSLRHLEDDQLDALLRAANAEAERRGWKVPRADPRGPRGDAARAAPRASARKRTGSPPLTPGQEKIVRAALAAGAGPAAIARQFGIPRTQVLRIAAAAKRGE